MTPGSVKDFAARLAGSGIAAGAIASRHIAMLCGFQNSIGLDMGGTSTDVSLAYEGQSRVTKDWYVEFGYPIRFSSIEVLTIGAGGGSLAWIDEAGSLRNGPQSAGANPGPACYGNGNHQADQHRRQCRARAAGHRASPAARSCSTPQLAADAVDDGVAKSFGLTRRGGRGRHHPRRQRQHVGCGAPDLDQPRLRSARFRAGRLRRRRRAARRRDRRELVDSGRDRAAQSRRHLGAGLPAGRRAARLFRKLHRRRGRGRPRRDRGAPSPGWRRKRSSASRHEGVAASDIVLQRTIDMMYQGQWRSLAVAGAEPDRCDDAIWSRRSTAARARIQFPPRRRAGRPVPPQPEGGRRRAEGRTRRCTSRPARRRRPSSRRPVWFEADTLASRRRSTSAPTCRRASCSPGPPWSSRSIPPS